MLFLLMKALFFLSQLTFAVDGLHFLISFHIKDLWRVAENNGGPKANENKKHNHVRFSGKLMFAKDAYLHK